MIAQAIRYFELLRAVRAQLDTQATATILGGPGRVWLARSRPSKPPWPEGKPGGRLVVQSTSTLWPDVDRGLEPRHLGVLVRSDFNDAPDASYDVAVSIEAAQAEAYRLLSGWLPPAPMTYARVVLPFFLYQPHDPEPRFDDVDRVFYGSSVFRTLVTFVPV